MTDRERLLCKAFCDGLKIRAVPAGLAVSTVFQAPDGDRIGFYISENRTTGLFRIEDNGMMLPLLEASGFEFKGETTRAKAMRELLAEYGVQIDRETREFVIPDVTEDNLPSAAMRFVAFSLRVRDFHLLSEHNVANTFRDDVKKLLVQTVGERAIIEDTAAIAASLSDFPADFVLRPPNRPPVGVYLGTSDARVLQALFVHMRAIHEVHEPCSVVALLERGKNISAPVRQQAGNRLSAVAEFRGDEVAAIQRIAYEAFGQTAATRH